MKRLVLLSLLVFIFNAGTASAWPTTKEQCWNGGWKHWPSLFKNQGDCIKYIVTGKV